VFGSRVDSILTGLRPGLLINGFKKKLDWSPGKDVPPELARGLKAYRADGAFASLSDNLAINFFEVFLVAMGGGTREVGLMASVANLMGFLSLAPGVAAVRWFGRRLPVVLLGGGGIGRLMYLALAFVPLLAPDPRWAIPAVIACNGLRIFMANFSNPAWTGMTADLVPEKIRGSYFGSRNSLIAILGSIATLSSGSLVGWGNGLKLWPNFGYTLLFGLTFGFGMVATYFFSKVPDLGKKIERKRRGFGALLRGMMQYPVFIGFLAFSFLWNFSLMISGPFFNVYMLKDLGATPLWIGITATTGNLVQIFAMPLWGRRVDARGDLKVLVLTGFLIPFLPLLWMLTSAPWHPGILNAIGGFIWAGFNLANFNLLLKMIPASDQQEGAAIYQGLVLLSTALGPLAGAEIVMAVGFKAAFAASAVGRYAALAILMLFVVKRLRKENAA
jgi:MFS family permease